MKTTVHSRRRLSPGRLVGACLLVGLICGCAERTEEMPRTIEEVLAAESATWMSLPGVNGTAEGLCGETPCILIYASDPGIRSLLPTEIDGHPIDVKVTGEFQALDSLSTPDPEEP